MAELPRPRVAVGSPPNKQNETPIAALVTAVSDIDRAHVRNDKVQRDFLNSG